VNSDGFWTIIEAARRKAGDDLEGRVDALGAQLAALSAQELQSFQALYDEQIRRSFRWDLWGAAYLMNGGCSDDGFRYFRDWLISEGPHTFEAALRSPESLADLPRVELAELELYGYVALQAYEAKTGGELARDFSTEIAAPTGTQWVEDDLPALFPRLAALYQP
jgi:hypothetical protein